MPGCPSQCCNNSRGNCMQQHVPDMWGLLVCPHQDTQTTADFQVAIKTLPCVCIATAASMHARCPYFLALLAAYLRIHASTSAKSLSALAVLLLAYLDLVLGPSWRVSERPNPLRQLRHAVWYEIACAEEAWLQCVRGSAGGRKTLSLPCRVPGRAASSPKITDSGVLIKCTTEISN